MALRRFCHFLLRKTTLQNDPNRTAKRPILHGETSRIARRFGLFRNALTINVLRSAFQMPPHCSQKWLRMCREQVLEQPAPTLSKMSSAPAASRNTTKQGQKRYNDIHPNGMRNGNHQQTPINHIPSTINNQQSTTSHQPPPITQTPINHQLSTINQKTSTNQ